MKWTTTRIYEQNCEAWLTGKRRALNEGGTASSKTWSILQLLVLIARHTKTPLLISCVSESLPHLKKGAIKDFFDVLDEDQGNSPRYNKTDQWYSFGKGRIEFFGADEPGKVRGPRRDILFLNEANNIRWETARGLDVRTRKFTIADWNPVSEFWAHENWLSKDAAGNIIGTAENQYIHSTYKDAEALLFQSEIDNILKTADRDPNWANVYLHGRIGKIEGLVYPYFEQIDLLPSGDIFYGLDFGFATDPTALVKCVIHGDILSCQELIFETGLTNQDIANKMSLLGINKGYDEIFADSAEPKSIEEIHRLGYNIKPASKGPGSVEFGHQLVRQYKQAWTKDSTNAIKEQRNFRYIPDKNGSLTEKTAHQWSHLMDARRYGVMGKGDYRGYAFDV